MSSNLPRDSKFKSEWKENQVVNDDLQVEKELGKNCIAKRVETSLGDLKLDTMIYRIRMNGIYKNYIYHINYFQ